MDRAPFKLLYTYNSKGLLQECLVTAANNLNDTNLFNNYVDYEYEYDSLNNLHVYYLYDWVDTLNNWVGNSKLVIDYDVNGGPLTATSFFLNDTSWVVNYTDQYETSYDNFGRPISVKIKTIDGWDTTSITENTAYFFTYSNIIAINEHPTLFDKNGSLRNIINNGVLLDLKGRKIMKFVSTNNKESNSSRMFNRASGFYLKIVGSNIKNAVKKISVK